MGKKDYSNPVRLRAKELKIKNWHLKKIENLEEEIAEIEEGIENNVGSNESSVPKISYGQLLDLLDAYAISILNDAFEALDFISKPYYADAVESFDSLMRMYPGIGESMDLDTLYEFVVRGCKRQRIARESFDRFIHSVACIYRGKDWVIDYNAEIIHMPNKPSFNLAWHIDVWSKQNKDRKAVYRVLAILTSPEDSE